jgi:hypothetical protein
MCKASARTVLYEVFVSVLRAGGLSRTSRVVGPPKVDNQGGISNGCHQQAAKFSVNLLVTANQIRPAKSTKRRTRTEARRSGVGLFSLSKAKHVSLLLDLP